MNKINFCAGSENFEFFQRRGTGTIVFNVLKKNIFGETNETCFFSVAGFADAYMRNNWHSITPENYAEWMFHEQGHTQMKCYTKGRTLRFYIDDILIRISKKTYEFAAFHSCPINKIFKSDDIRAYFTFHTSIDQVKPSPGLFNGVPDRVLHVQDIDYGC